MESMRASSRLRQSTVRRSRLPKASAARAMGCTPCSSGLFCLCSLSIAIMSSSDMNLERELIIDMISGGMVLVLRLYSRRSAPSSAG